MGKENLKTKIMPIILIDLLFIAAALVLTNCPLVFSGGLLLNSRVEEGVCSLLDYVRGEQERPQVERLEGGGEFGMNR